jgi:two-component system response regulator (stage 0 sporulation protein F)
MADLNDFLQEMSGTTKALIIVNEFNSGKMQLPQLHTLLECLVFSDLERIGIMELIKIQAAKSGMSQEDINILVGGLSGVTPSVAEPANKDNTMETTQSPPKKKTLSVMPLQNTRQRRTTNVHKKHLPPKVGYSGTKKETESTFFGSSPVKINRNTLKMKKDKTVLIADDDPRIRMIFRMKISGAGYNIIEAEDGDVAWEKVQNAKPDAIVMDMKMPGLHGLELLAKLTGMDKKIPVCVCSAYDQLRDEFVIANYPHLNYFVKPVDADELLVALKKMVPIY